MVERNYFQMLSDEKKAQYKFGFCVNCPFYECELVGEYTQFRENHVYKSQVPIAECVDVGSYDQSKLMDGCIMNCRHVYQIECGDKRVTDGIGDHFQIEIDDNGNIKENIENRWEPLQPVFISAQTGKGKNYFIENTLIPYVRELNYKEKTNYKILIFSNRLALKYQIKYRIDGNDNLDDENSERDIIYPYNKVVDVMTYQGLLRQAELRKGWYLKYSYVICDEAHFFTSDAMFNPHTHKILETIVRLFQNAVRVYMSATPYECLEFIIKCEEEERERLNLKKYGEDQSKWKYEKMVFYHFKRDYSYLDVKTYSSISELYDEIVKSVVQRKEKWLIFIDDKEKCVREKDNLEKLIKDKESSLAVEKKKDGEDAGADKDNEAEKKVDRVYAIDANSKKGPIYQEIVKNERLNKDTYVLISTSVLDNGINLEGINNIVVSDMEKSKCLQMVGRARVSDINDRKTLYMKRICDGEVDKRIKNLMRQQDAYHSYELAYDENAKAYNYKGQNGYVFVNKYYEGKDTDWEDAKHWFGRPFVNATTKLYLNEIAKSLVEKLISKYQYILNEMEEEKNEQQNQESENRMGQKYLEYQISWFGKKYCADDDITIVDKEKSKKEFLAFLESYAESGKEIVGEEEMQSFQVEFTRLHDEAFPRAEKNLDRVYKYQKMNKLLNAYSIGYRLDGRPQKGPWKLIRADANEVSPTEISDMQIDEETIQEKNMEPIAGMLDTREQADNDETALAKSKTKKHFKIDPKIMKENTMRCKSKRGRR